MEDQLKQIRDQQKESWNKFSPGWKKWNDITMDFLQPMGDAIMERVHPLDSDIALDIASGTGEPGISIAKRCPHGKMILTDLSDGMLEIARENAHAQGIQHIETRVCDVSELPFEDNTFNVVSCRFGFMFFPDMQLAANEMVRVLKPGGRLATAVWSGPEKNFWVTAIGGTINKNMQLEPPAPGAPGMFRCATPGLIRGLFESAGLNQVQEREINGKLRCGTAENYWNMMTDIAAPFVAALSKADDALRAKIKQEVIDLVHQHFPEHDVQIPCSALVISGVK